jgi:hypothetical protein
MHAALSWLVAASIGTDVPRLVIMESITEAPDFAAAYSFAYTLGCAGGCNKANLRMKPSLEFWSKMIDVGSGSGTVSLTAPLQIVSHIDGTLAIAISPYKVPLSHSCRILSRKCLSPSRT